MTEAHSLSQDGLTFNAVQYVHGFKDGTYVGIVFRGDGWHVQERGGSVQPIAMPFREALRRAAELAREET